LHQALDLNVPIGCGNVAVFPSDIMLGNDDYAIVIPAHLAEEIADEAVEMTAFEDFVIDQVCEGVSIIGLYPATREKIRMHLLLGERRQATNIFPRGLLK
jgi:regulator of RNase E activity RraA